MSTYIGHIDTLPIGLKVKFLYVHGILTKVADLTSMLSIVAFVPMEITQLVELVRVLCNSTLTLH